MRKNITLILCAIIFVVTILEICARTLYHDQNYYAQTLYEFHPVLGHAFKKDYTAVFNTYEGEKFTFATNSEGWRSEEFDKEAISGVKRIVFLGDSFLESAGARLEDTLPKAVERELNDVSKDRYECLNFGLGDIGQSEEYIIWKKYAKDYKPDIVVLQLFLFNDILNNSLYYGKLLNNAGDRTRPYIKLDDKSLPVITCINPAPSFFRRHFNLYRRIEVRTLTLMEERRKKLNIKTKKQIAWLSSREKGFFPPGENLLFLENSVPEHYELAWGHTERLILEIANDVESSGAEFFIVSIPWQEQVDNTHKIIKISDQNDEVYEYRLNYELPEKKLKVFLEKHEIKGYSLLYDLREYLKVSGDSNMDLWGDGHLNKKALRIAGESLSRHLVEALGL